MKVSLEYLRSIDLLQSTLHVATVEALVEVLRADPVLTELRKWLSSHAIDPTAVDAFVRELLGGIQIGRRSAYDVSLAAMAVMLERRPGPHADTYLKNLSKLNIRELPMSPRVARQCLSFRSSFFTTNTVRKGRLGTGAPPMLQAPRAVERAEACSNSNRKSYPFE
jgi:hypothetical protein